jgi:transcription initiation factor TFIIB
MGSALGIDRATRQVGLRLFRQAAEEGLLVGRAIESIASGCLYAAARVNDYPRSFDEIAHVSRVEVDRIITAYEAVRDHFDLTLQPVDPAAYLDRFATGCDAPMKVTRTARRIIDVAQNRDGKDESIIGGTSPTSVAAAALFAAADLHDTSLTQQEIADVADVHVTTIRNNYPALQRVYQESQSE